MTVKKGMQRRIVVTLHKEGLSVPEVARRLKLKDDAVRDHLEAEGIFSAKEVPPTKRKDRSHYEPKHKPEPEKPHIDMENPVVAARIVLGPRVQERLGSYWVDGAPVSVHGLIQSANSSLKQWGMQQILGNPEWLV